MLNLVEHVLIVTNGLWRLKYGHMRIQKFYILISSSIVKINRINGETNYVSVSFPHILRGTGMETITW